MPPARVALIVYPIYIRLFLLKETEIHTAIGYMTEEAWMLAEIIILAMFKNKHTAWLEQTTIKHQIGDALEFFQRIGRISKYKVISSW